MNVPHRTFSLFVACLAAGLQADEVDFARDIRPILSDNCYHCHGPDENSRQSEVRLDTQSGLMGKTESGKLLVVPGKVSASVLVQRIDHPDDSLRMPPADSNRKLTDKQKELLRKWVEQGAKWKGHWSFQPIERPAVPIESGFDSFPIRNPIDAFIARRLRERKWTPNDPAARERLIRRVTFDLTGLPPTVSEVQAFIGDRTPDAFEKVVNRLLDSPRYGERMSWEWLNVARYADTNGFQGDRERTMWPWRDWAIRAFNNNMPYDQFTVWQIAGDMLPKATLEQQLASGFCRNHMINGEGGRIAEENRIEYIFDQMETVGTVWMGLTMQCCRCHDHKFDPISRKEYYGLFAFFNQTPVNGGGGDPQMAPNIAFPTRFDQERLKALEDKADIARLALEKAEALLLKKLDSTENEKNKEFAKTIAALKRPLLQRKKEELDAVRAYVNKSEKGVAALLKSYEDRRRERDQAHKRVPRVMVMKELDKPRKTFMLTKGLYNQREGEVSAHTPEILPELHSKKTPNRLDLAKWLVSPSHPLTARVTVNRYWQMVYGSGLVKTAEDFGTQGERPTHPDLLDWLASDFVASNWDVKRLIKMMVMSSTYRQSDRVSKEAFEADPDNRYFSRIQRRRLESWMIRDQALAAAGQLEGRLGGSPVQPYQPAGVWAEATFGKKRYNQSQGKDLYRRTLYTFWRRIVGPTMLFDEARRQTCSVRQNQTNTPLHALVTLNDTTYLEAARILAQAAMQASTRDSDRVAWMFESTLSRKPSKNELDILVKRYTKLREQYKRDLKAAIDLLSVGESKAEPELDSNQLAALTGIGSLILNLDEALTK